MKKILLMTLTLLASCGGKNGEKDLKHKDIVQPSISLIGNDYLEIEYGTPYLELGAKGFDKRDGVISDIKIEGTVNTNILGEYKLSYTVKDKSGNTKSITRKVKIIDSQAPSIVLNGPQTLYLDVNSNYNESGATASDDYDGNLSSNIEIEGSVNNKVLGNYDLLYKISDSSGNLSSVSRRIVVRDLVKPKIYLKGESLINVEVNTSYNDQGAFAFDNYDGDISGSISSTNNLELNTLGVYNYTYNGIDSSGNIAESVVRTVNVVDTTAPVMTLIGSNPARVELGDVYTDEGLEVTDNYDSNLTASELIRNINMNAIGDYSIIFSTKDSSNNQTTIKRDVIVRDTINPVLSIDEETVFFKLNEVSSVDLMKGVSATDLDFDRIDVSGNVNLNIAGDYTVEYTAYDKSGNNTTKSRTYKVLDMPFMYLATDTSSNLASPTELAIREASEGYGFEIYDYKLFEVVKNAVSSPTQTFNYTNNLMKIHYDRQILGSMQYMYFYEENVGLYVLDLAGENEPTKIERSDLSNGSFYTIEKAVITDKGLFFQSGSSFYYVNHGSSIGTFKSNFTNVITSISSSIKDHWTAFGKYLVTYENDGGAYLNSLSNNRIWLQDVSSTSTSKTTILAEDEFIFSTGYPEFDSQSSVRFTTDGKTLFLKADGILISLNENTVIPFIQAKQEFIYLRLLDGYKIIKDYNDVYPFIRGNNNDLLVWRKYNYNTLYVQTQNRSENPFSLNLLGTMSFTKIDQLIHYKDNFYIVVYTDLVGLKKMQILEYSTANLSIPKLKMFKFFNTFSKQVEDLDVAIGDIFIDENHLYVMPDNTTTNRLYNIGTNSNSILLKIAK